ncbi:MAG: GNAT family N-acetyltransferase [Anaerolineales bacterium]|nr:GNAT family N-acetyltransferase [Anaerolineales bacterium]
MSQTPDSPPLSPPAGFHWRPVQRDDVPAIQQLTVATAAVDKTEGPASPQNIQQIFALLGDEMPRNSLAGLTPAGEIVALAMVFFRPADNERLAMISGTVHPDYRARGLGSYLLAWMEARVQQQAARDNNDQPVRVQTSCADHLQDRMTLFGQHGFAPIRYAYKMRHPLAQQIAKTSLPDGLQLIPWHETHSDAARQAFNIAFQDIWGVPEMDTTLWQQFFVGVPQFRPDLSWLVLADETIVAFCINWVNERNQEGWVEAVGVLPAWRGRGVAAALLTQSLHEFQALGLKSAGLDVDTENPTGALQLYEKLGFAAIKRTIFFSKPLN